MWRPLIRNIAGKQRPLIMHPRMYWLVRIDIRARYYACRFLGMQYRGPRYMTPRRTPAQRARSLLVIEAYLGRRSPDPRLVRYYEERLRLMRLTAPGVSDDAKRKLVAEGPLCSPEDEAHVLGLYQETGKWAGGSDAQAGLSEIKQVASAEAIRLSVPPG